MDNQKAKKPLSKGTKIGVGVGAAVVVLLIAALYYVFVVTNLGKFFLAQFKSDTPEQQLSFSSASDTARTTHYQPNGGPLETGGYEEIEAGCRHLG